MPEYQLKFTDEQDDFEESRQQTMAELHEFIAAMDDLPSSTSILGSEYFILWDQEGDIDYQDAYGREIIAQISDNITETLVIRNTDGLPVALAALHEEAGWQGLGIDKRLRFEIATMIQNDETEFISDTGS